MMRPWRRFIMPFTAARERRKADSRLTVSTVLQSSSFMRMNRPSRVTPALLTRMSSGPAAASASGTSFSTARRVGEVAGDDEGALAQFGGQRVERLAAGARQHDLRALLVQRAGDGGAEAAGRAGDESDAIVQAEHEKLPRALMKG